MYSRDRLIKAIDNSACLTRRQIDDYLQNKLFPEELYVVEMHLNECPFCNDAVEGYTKSGNANQILSTVEEFSFTTIPVRETQPEPAPVAPKAAEVKAAEKKVAPAPPPPPVPEKVKEVKKTPPAEPVKKVTFDNEPKRSRKLVPIGIAAAVVLGLGIWGITKIGGDKNANNMLADKGSAASGEQVEDGMFNESSINREEDSAMNAKYGFQNQRPMAGGHYSGRQSGYTGDGQMSDTASMAMMADAAATEQASPAVARAEERSSGFVGPVLPREEEQRRKAATAPASADKAKVMASTAKAKAEPAKPADKTIAANSKDAKNKTAAAPPANARTTAAKETAKPAESKAAASSPALAQADKDYKKGLELYNKKQYSASIMYFQSAAKVKEYPNRSKAESYIKLAKSEVVNAERKKNSEKNNDK